MRPGVMLEYEAQRDAGLGGLESRILTVSQWATVHAALRLAATDFAKLSTVPGIFRGHTRRQAAAAASDLAAIIDALERQS